MNVVIRVVKTAIIEYASFLLLFYRGFEVWIVHEGYRREIIIGVVTKQMFAEDLQLNASVEERESEDDETEMSAMRAHTEIASVQMGRGDARDVVRTCFGKMWTRGRCRHGYCMRWDSGCIQLDLQPPLPPQCALRGTPSAERHRLWWGVLDAPDFVIVSQRSSYVTMEKSLVTVITGNAFQVHISQWMGHSHFRYSIEGLADFIFHLRLRGF
ncbi:hypothetical protein BKA93DRAFT_750185 [Sparassis latifolia]